MEQCNTCISPIIHQRLVKYSSKLHLKYLITAEHIYFSPPDPHLSVPNGRGGRLSVPNGRGGRLSVPNGRGCRLSVPNGRGGRLSVPNGRGGRLYK